MIFNVGRVKVLDKAFPEVCVWLCAVSKELIRMELGGIANDVKLGLVHVDADYASIRGCESCS